MPEVAPTSVSERCRAASEDHREPLRRSRPSPWSSCCPTGPRALSSAAETEIVAQLGGIEILATPELGRPRAYVKDEIDFTGGRGACCGSPGDGRLVAHGRETARARMRSVLHRWRSNKANVQHHYDVSDAFYRLW
jgi:hypothetical protein